MNFEVLKSRFYGLIKKFFKFAQVGLFVTVLSLILSFVFLKIIGTPLIITYVLLYTATIALSFFLNSRYTFKSKGGFKKLILYYASYGTTMLLGIILLSIFRRILPFENWVLVYFVLPFTMSTNFLLSSLVFKIRK